MIDIKLIRENRELVKENIKKKFQDEKLGLVDEVYEYDKSYRECKMKVDELRAKRNSLSASIGVLMRDKKLDEVEKIKNEVSNINEEIEIINSSYGTATALKDVLKNMFNARNYPEVNLQKCLLSDKGHRELFFKILDMPLSYIDGKQILDDFFNDK